MASAERPKGPDFDNLPPKVAINRWRFLRRESSNDGLTRGGFTALGWGLGILLGSALALPLIPAGAVPLLALNIGAAAGKLLSIVGGASAAVGLAKGAVDGSRAY